MDEIIEQQERRFLDKCQAIDELYESYAKKFGLTYMFLPVLESVFEHKNDCTQKLIAEDTHYP